MRIFVLCALGVALYNLGFYFGYSRGYEQKKTHDKHTETHECVKDEPQTERESE